MRAIADNRVQGEIGDDDRRVGGSVTNTTREPRCSAVYTVAYKTKKVS